MIDKNNFPDVLRSLDFQENNNVFLNQYDSNSYLKVDFNTGHLIYPEDQGLTVNERQTCNFSQNENFVVFECVHRLLVQGYKPEHIELEPKWQVGHGASGGRADVLIKDNQGDTLLIIECKTAGSEFNKAWNRTQQDGGQLFSYVKQTSTTQFICLYASNWIDDQVKPNYYLISLNDNEKLINELSEVSDDPVSTYADSKLRNVEDIVATWKDTYQSDYMTRGLFEPDIQPYNIGKQNYSLDDLVAISSNDIQGKYNEFATIMRQHNVSGRENAFDKLVNLFLCKIVDETHNPQDLKFNWKGISYDSPFDLQDRLQALYQQGMKKFLDEEVTYVRDDEVETAFRFYKNDPVETQKAIKAMFRRLKFFTNNDFAFIDVHNERLFGQNSDVLLKIVKMLQDIRLKTNEENQFLGDMFEGFLDQGVKQSEGQFFTPMPIVKFIMNALPLDNLIATSDDIPKVIDYACGAGHFLNEYATSIRPTIENNSDKNLSEYYDNITGIEKEYRLSKVAKVSAFMYGQDDINIIYADALGSNEDIQNNSYSVLVANPPYSVKGFLDTLKPSERKQFELLKYIEEKSYTVNNSIETFFIERAKQLLKTGGVATIIVPSSILTKGKASSTSSSKNIYVATREIILKHFDIVAIAEFGSGTFGKTGTNTVTLFLRRKTTDAPVEADHYAQRVDNWFNPIQNSSLSSNEVVDTGAVFADSHFIDDYCTHLALDADDYKTLLAGTPNEALMNSEYFASYVKEFDKWTEIKRLKNSKTFKAFSKDKQKAELNRRLVNYLKATEKDKVYYFVLASLNPQPVLIIKSPSKTKEMKAFLGYEWSSAKGNEGIKYLGGFKMDDLEAVDEDSGEVAIEEEDKRVLSNLYNLDNINTPLYNPKDKSDDTKINYLISQNFQKENFLIPDELESFVTQSSLIDMLDFKVVDFNKAISLAPKIDLNIDTQWNISYLGDVVDVLIGGTPSRSNNSYFDGNHLWLSISEMNGHTIIDTKEKITDSGIANSNVKLIPKGTTLLSFKLSIGKTAIAGQDLYTNEAIAGLVPKDNSKLLNSFIFQIFNAGIIPLTKSGLNTFGQSLNKSFLESNVKIPLPPIKVQEQIINDCQIVDNEAEQAKDQTEELRNEIDKIINESANSLNSQKTKIGSALDLKAGKFISASDITNNYHESLYPCYGGNGLRGYTRTFTHEGDYCLIGRQGALCGNITRVSGKFHATEHAVVVTPLTDINETWLYYKLVNLDLNQYATGVAQPGLSVTNIDNIDIVINTIEEQNKIANDIKVLELKLEEAQAIIDTSTDKKHAIIKSYL